MRLTFKLNESGKSYMVRMNNNGKAFTVEVTKWGYFIPTEVELSGKLRPASDFEKDPNKVQEKVPFPLVKKVIALGEMLIADTGTLPSVLNQLNAAKIKTLSGNYMYQIWMGSDMLRSVFCFLNPKFQYRTSSPELKQNHLLNVKDWLKLKGQLAVAGKVQPERVTVENEKVRMLVMYLYLRKVIEIEEEAKQSYLHRMKQNSPANPAKEVAKPAVVVKDKKSIIPKVKNAIVIYRIGAKGSEILKLKKKLVAKKLLSKANNDVFDQAMLEAVKKFQTTQKVTPDGVIGETTAKLLNGRKK